MMVLLYKTDSDENAVTVEEDLIKRFTSHDKCRNEAESGSGRIPQKESGEVIYLCLFCDKSDQEFLMRLLEEAK